MVPFGPVDIEKVKKEMAVTIFEPEVNHQSFPGDFKRLSCSSKADDD